jgi:Flp pilus assembly protein TadG
MHARGRGARRQRGAAALEFHVVALFAMLPMLLGMLQVALLLVANHQVDFAAFMAARAGATEGGREAAMRTAFADALVPMFLGASAGTGREAMTRAIVEARVRAAADVALHGQIRLLSPTPEARRELAVERDGLRVIPNDSLGSRTRRPGGAGLLAANILAVEATWCHPLIVPVARSVLLATMRRIDLDPWHQACYANERLPIRSRGVVPMQSDFIVDP